MVKRLLFVLLSAAALAAVARVAVQGAATLEARSSSAATQLLAVGAAQLAKAVQRSGDDLPQLAQQFPVDPADSLASQDLKSLIVAVNFVEPGRTPPQGVQNRIEQLTTKMRDRMAAYRAQHAEVDATALVTEAGVVLLSESEVFKVGENLSPGQAAQVAAQAAAKKFAAEVAAAQEAGERAPTPPANLKVETVETKGLLDDVLLGVTGQGVRVHDGTLHFWGAAPILLKGKVAGALITTRRLRTLPEVSGLEAFMVVGGAVILGKAPEGFSPQTSVSNEPVLLAARAAQGKLFGAMELPFSPMFTSTDRIGVFGFGAPIERMHAARVFVTNDVTPLFVELASWQVTILFAAFVAWLLHSVVFMLQGRGVVRGIDRMADFLGRLHQGHATERLLNERQLPSELLRLIRLVNKTIEQPGAALAAVAPLAKAPSLDDVFNAQAVEPPADLGELEFEGITNAGTLSGEDDAALQLSPPASRAVPPPPPQEDEAPEQQPIRVPQRTSSLTSGESQALFSLPGVKPPPPLDSPAASIYDGLDDAEAPPPKPSAPPSSAFGGGSPATAVMQMSPELLAQLKAMAGEVDDQAGDAAVVASADAAVLEQVEEAAVEAAVEDPDTHYREVFDSFVETRRTCGETGELGFEKFKTRLVESRAAVLAKHNCKDVRFQVYVKNGKAALKATPFNG